MNRALEVAASRRIEDLRLVDRSGPTGAAPGHILVRMGALGLNYRDLLVATAHDRWAPPDGRILGSDGVGTVTAVGVGVSRFQIGDRVVTTILPNWIDGPLTAEKRMGAVGGPSADGVFAEEVMLPEWGAVVAPAYLSSAEAATLPVAALTAWHALQRASVLREDATVLVQGAGGVSIFALQIALAAGARVLAISRSDQKLERMRMLGATATLNSTTTPQWGHRVFELADDRGVGCVIDIGGASTLNESIEAAAVNGVISVVGLTGGLRLEMNLADIFQKNLRLDGIETGSTAMLQEMIGWFGEKRIRPVVDSIFPFEESPDAFLRLQSGDHFGKVCMAVESRSRS